MSARDDLYDAADNESADVRLSDLELIAFEDRTSALQEAGLPLALADDRALESVLSARWHDAGPLFGGSLDLEPAKAFAAAPPSEAHDAKRHGPEDGAPGRSPSLDTRSISAEQPPPGLTKKFRRGSKGPGDLRSEWVLPRAIRSFVRSVTAWDHDWLDTTTGEVFDRNKTVADHVGHEIVNRASATTVVGRKKLTETTSFERKGGLPKPERNKLAEPCEGCGADVPAGKGWWFQTVDDGLRCAACADRLWPRINAKYRLRPVREQLAAARKKKNKKVVGAIGSLSRELGISEDEAGLLLNAGLPEVKKPRHLRGHDERLGPLRNKPCACGSDTKFKECCHDRPGARGLAKRVAAQRALVATLMRLSRSVSDAKAAKALADRASRVRKCRSRFEVFTCSKTGKKKTGKSVFICGDRLCPLCAHARSERAVARSKDAIHSLVHVGRIKLQWLSKLTLTVENLPKGSLVGAFAWLRACWSRFLHLIAVKYPCRHCGGSGREPDGAMAQPLELHLPEETDTVEETDTDGREGKKSKTTRKPRHAQECSTCCGTRSVIQGGIRSMETTATEEAGWHPHIHALIAHSPLLDQTDLAAAWLIATEGRGRTSPYIERVTRRGDWTEVEADLRETLKYESKVLSVPDDFVPELTDAIKGEHLRDSFGLLRGIEFEREAEDERVEEPVTCDCCASPAPMARSTGWLWGKARWRALLNGGERVWPGMMNPEVQKRIPGTKDPPPTWTDATKLTPEETVRPPDNP